LFGYGPAKDNPGLYMMWITDEAGTHYFLTDSDSEQLFGTIDPLTDNRRDDGFVHFIQERADKVEEIDDKASDVLAEQNNRISSHILAVAVAGIGGLTCTVLTGGACLVAFAGAALAAWGKGVFHNGNRLTEEHRLELLQVDLDEINARLKGKFTQTLAVESVP